jgi:hypothetical protein
LAVRTAATRSGDPQAQPTFQPVKREGLAGRRDGDGPIGHAGVRRQRPVLTVEHDVLVDLVGHGQQVTLDAELCNRRQLAIVQHHARGVVRRVHENQARSVGDAGRQGIDVEPELGWLERHAPQRGTRHGCGRGVGVVGGFECNDLVAHLAERHQRGGDRLGRAGRDEHLGVGVERQVPEAALVGGDGVAEVGRADAGWVLVVTRAYGCDRRLGHLHRAIDVGEALPQIDGAGPDSERRHLGEDRGAHSLQP